MRSKEEILLVWLKRDLRLSDHEPFFRALQQQAHSGQRILPFYCFEPSASYYYDFDIRHWRFVAQSLLDMNERLRTPVTVFNCEVPQALEAINSKYKVISTFSHEETGTTLTYERDKQMGKLFRQETISWQEFPAHAVIRGLKNRTGWDAQWIKTMKAKTFDFDVEQLKIVEPLASDFPKESLTIDENFQQGGEKAAKERLNYFLSELLPQYFGNISKPSKATYTCSRLSAYISWGNITIRQINKELDRIRPHISNKKSLNQFQTRTKWQSHFIQKFEMEEELEHTNQNPVYDQFRTKKNKKYIKAWKEGSTGYPLVDASMRCVVQTGYLNFRMRAMAVSFFTHLLWQPWKEGARFLARNFLDYEPGIHFPQFQMQAATTGIHTIRIYNPVKQAKDKDPKAEFIKEWLPELRELPSNLALEPWNITPMEEAMYGFQYGKDYPRRIIDHEEASKKARDILWRVKNEKKTKKFGKKIVDKHTNHSRSWR